MQYIALLNTLCRMEQTDLGLSDSTTATLTPSSNLGLQEAEILIARSFQWSTRNSLCLFDSAAEGLKTSPTPTACDTDPAPYEQQHTHFAVKKETTKTKNNTVQITNGNRNHYIIQLHIDSS